MFKNIEKLLPVSLRRYLMNLPQDEKRLKEIRLRVGGPAIFFFGEEEFYVTKYGLCAGDIVKPSEFYVLTREDIAETMDNITNYSLYAYEDEIRQGYITVCGGHRIGLCGQAVWNEGGVTTMKNISFLNMRIAHQMKGCGNEVLPYIIKNGRVLNTLIVSPPGGGKTTLLRDVIRLLSDGNPYLRGVNVGVVDERSELAACYMGVPQNEIGVRTDVLDGYKKSEGMLMLVRSMNPKVIAVDEIGGREDLAAIHTVLRCGCGILATVHGEAIDDIRTRPTLRKFVEERIFDRYILLGQTPGEIISIFDERGNDLFVAAVSIAN